MKLVLMGQNMVKWWEIKFVKFWVKISYLYILQTYINPIKNSMDHSRVKLCLLHEAGFNLYDEKGQTCRRIVIQNLLHFEDIALSVWKHVN